MDTGSVLVILFSSNVISGLSDNLVSLYSNGQNAEYVDIDEGAIVKVEFSKTLRWFINWAYVVPRLAVEADFPRVAVEADY